MVSKPLNRCSDSSASERCSRVKGGRYVPMSGVQVGLVTILQLNMFGPWKRVDSIPHPLGQYLVTRPTPPWPPLALYGRTFGHVTSYPRRLCEYVSVYIFVSVRSTASNPLCSTAWMVCDNPKPLPSWMCSGLMASLGGRRGKWRGGASTAAALCAGDQGHG